MNQYARAHVDPESRANEQPLRFILSAPGVKRDGLDLDLTKMNLDQFRRNPVMPWMHGMDPSRGALPIGRWADVRLTAQSAIVATADFDADDDFARGVERKYRSGYLNAASIGFLYDFDEGNSELLEASAVSVPADPDALVQGRNLVMTERGEYQAFQERIVTLEAELRRRAVRDALRAV